MRESYSFFSVMLVVVVSVMVFAGVTIAIYLFFRKKLELMRIVKALPVAVTLVLVVITVVIIVQIILPIAMR